MASGFGINGGQGRCYSLWLDFTKCLGKSDFPSDCNDFREDYVECLHHQKEFARNKAIKDEMKRQEREKKDNAASEEVGVDSSG